MKSERRHELQKNQLADWLAGVIEKIKPYQNAILGVVILVVVASVGVSWWARRSAGKEAEAWDEVFAVMARGRMEPGEFEDVVDKYPGTDVAHWAATMAGDLRLAMGCNALFENKAAANQELRGAGDQDGAVDHYLKVLEESKNPMLRERATFGLGRAREALGELDKAQQHYQQVTEQWPNGTYAAMATHRLKDLQKPSIKELYDKFANYSPKPAYAEEPGTPGERLPFDPDILSDDGPLFQPKMKMELEEKGPKDDASKDLPETPTAPDATESDTSTPDTTTPDTTTPDTTTPDTTTPDATTPGTTTPDAAEPDATQSDTAKPEEAADPDATEPDAAEPGATKSDETKTDTAAPDTTPPDTAPAETTPADTTESDAAPDDAKKTPADESP